MSIQLGWTGYVWGKFTTYRVSWGVPRYSVIQTALSEVISVNAGAGTSVAWVAVQFIEIPDLTHPGFTKTKSINAPMCMEENVVGVTFDIYGGAYSSVKGVFNIFWDLP